MNFLTPFMKKQWNLFWTIALLMNVFLFSNSFAEEPKTPAKLEIKRPASEVKTSPEEYKLKDPDKNYKRIFKTSPPGHRLSEKQKRTAKSAKKILEEAGIDFPKGTNAELDWDTGVLTVNHNPEGMLLIEAYIDRISSSAERALQWQVEIYRLPALLVLELQDSSIRQADHAPERDAVLKLVKKGQARLITSLSLECRSGQRAKFVDGKEYRFIDHYEWQKDSDTVLPVFEERLIGTIFEIDPVLGADNITIDLSFSLEHHTAPPEHELTQIRLPESDNNIEFSLPVFHCKTIITQITIRSGTTQIVGTFRPSGKPEYKQEDLMDIVFLKSTVMFVDPKESSLQSGIIP